jgi:YD repeat-containing protein
LFTKQWTNLCSAAQRRSHTAYDSDGNVTSVSESLGGVVASGYDPNGWLTTRQFSGPGGVQARFDPAYTADGQVATVTRYRRGPRP